MCSTSASEGGEARWCQGRTRSDTRKGNNRRREADVDKHQSDGNDQFRVFCCDNKSERSVSKGADC